MHVFLIASGHAYCNASNLPSCHIRPLIFMEHVLQALRSGTVAQLDGESVLANLRCLAIDTALDVRTLPAMWQLFQTGILSCLQQRYALVESMEAMQRALMLAKQHVATQPHVSYLHSNAGTWQEAVARSKVAETAWHATVRTSPFSSLACSQTLQP